MIEVTVILAVAIAIVIIIKGSSGCAHFYELKTTLPESLGDDEAVRVWINADYDVYKVCKHCGDFYGVGKKYD
jgi:hypothetical protein